MLVTGILYVEADYENGFNNCLLAVVNQVEIRGMVRFWNKNVLAGQMLSYTGLVHKGEHFLILDVKSYFVLPFAIPDDGMVLPMYLTAHGTLLIGQKLVSDVWVPDTKTLEKFTTKLVLDPKQKLPTVGSMMSVHGSVLSFENQEFSIKVHFRDFCPRDQKDSPKTPEKRPPKKPKFVSIEL
jgi:hypothetical protein